MAPFLGSQLSRSLRSFQVYGANTNVGKTIFSTILCNAFRNQRKNEKVWYLKPVSTGALQDADDRHVAKFAKGIETECLMQFEEPVSPHLVTAKPPSDETILRAICDRIQKYAKTSAGTFFLETAGGVHSPTLSGNSQADLYRPLRLPVLLIADSRIGGISSSISAFESLNMRGYDVEGVLLFKNDYYRNDGYLKEYFAKHGSKTGVFPPPPSKNHEDSTADQEAMSSYYAAQSSSDEVLDMLHHLESRHTERVMKLEKMSEEAHKYIWYPFMQHQDLSPKLITVIDSAHGDFFQTYSSGKGDSLLAPMFDGSASWWTQGLGHGNTTLTLSAAYASGRYGHVMFAGAIHEPALSLAKLLLSSLQNPRLTRVFYSDNGSTGCEVAVKMALKASRVRYGWNDREEAGVIGLKGSYHGDTLGVMDCSEPCDYNKEVDWYKGRGWWFDFPKVMMREGRWVIEVPEDLEEVLGGSVEFGSLAEIFDLEKRKGEEAGKRYEKYIYNTLERLIKKEGRRFGAVIMEPVVLGAGGMLFADPLFQSTLVSVTRSNPSLFSPTDVPQPQTTPSSESTWTGLPIIFDEVFTGLYRLGRLTPSSFLQTHPDISVHAKLLTGGLLPLSTTLASDSIFEAFLGGEKKDALMHGHSYTAHAVGCSVAETSVKSLIELDNAGGWEEAKKDWSVKGEEIVVWSSWSQTFITQISNLPNVEGVWALGSVLAIHLKTSRAGYSSTAANAFLENLRNNAGRDWKVHARALGSVAYVMTSQTSARETVAQMEAVVLGAL